MFLEQSEGWYMESELAFLSLKVTEVCKLGPVMEIGCYKGLSTSAIIDGLKTAQSPQPVIVIDDFRGVQPNYVPNGAELKARFLENMKKIDGLDKVVLIEGTSTDILPKMEGQFSLIHVDADHGDSTEIELRESWRLLRSGGVLVMDDVNLYINGRNEDVVGQAAKKLFGEITMVDIKVGWIQKP